MNKYKLNKPEQTTLKYESFGTKLQVFWWLVNSPLFLSKWWAFTCIWYNLTFKSWNLLKIRQYNKTDLWILSPNTKNWTQENKITQILTYRSRLCQRFREQKNESLPRLLTHLRRTVYRDAKLNFYIPVVTLKGPITKPIEIQINR